MNAIIKNEKIEEKTNVLIIKNQEDNNCN